MRSMLVAGRDGDEADRLVCTSELDPVAVSTSLRTLVVKGGGELDAASCRGGARRHATAGSTMSSLLRHTCDLLESSGVRPELVADFLRRRDVVSDETTTAIGRCVARRAACELLAEVVAGKAEVAALCDGLRAAGCGNVADCLAAVQALLQLTESSQLQRSDFLLPESSPSAVFNDRLLQ